ncbi:pathogenesis-related protein 1-like [Fagus crenata]
MPFELVRASKEKSKKNHCRICGTEFFLSQQMSIEVYLTNPIVHISYAQNSPADYVNAHNAARAQVGVGPMTWDANLAAFAQNYANQRKGDCRLVHSGGPYGENLAGSSGDLSGTAAVNLWVAEKPSYNYNSNSCVGGVCGHYTQVVWRNSARQVARKCDATTAAHSLVATMTPWQH